MLERGEKIDLLVDKTEALNASASKFKKSVRTPVRIPTRSRVFDGAHAQAKRVSTTMWWKNCKMKIIIVVLVLVRAAARSPACVCTRVVHCSRCAHRQAVLYFILALACKGPTLKGC